MPFTIERSKQLLTDLLLNNCWASKPDTERLLHIDGDKKICRCGKEYPLNNLPVSTKQANGILYFDCPCGAIDFVPCSAMEVKK